MPIDVGELQATLGINTRGFTDGVDSAQESLDGLIDRLGDGIQQSSADAADGLDSAKQGANEFSDAIEQAGKTSKTSAAKIKTAGQEAEKTGEKTETAGKKAMTAKEAFGKLKEVLSTVGIGIGISTVIAKITEVISKLREAYSLSESVAASFERTLGTDNANTQLYQGYINQLSSSTTLSEQDIANVVSKVIKTQQGATPEQVLNLSKQYLALGEMGNEFGSLTTNIDDAYVVFDKWGVSIDEQTEKLSLFMDICRNTNIDMTSLMTTLSQTDYIGKKLGYSIDDMATAIGNSGTSFDDLTTFLSRAETMYNQMYDTIAEADPDAAAESVDEAVREMWTAAMAEAESIPEAERGKFWATFFGAGQSSKIYNELAKGFSIVSNQGGQTFSSDVTPELLVQTTRTTAELTAISDRLQEMTNYQQQGLYQLIDEGTRRVAESNIENWNQYGTTSQLLLEEIARGEKTAPIVNVTVQGISDPYEVRTSTESSAVAAVSNPNYG